MENAYTLPSHEIIDIDCLDLKATRQHILARIRRILEDEVGQGPVNLNRYIEITDAAGTPVIHVSFCDAII